MSYDQALHETSTFFSELPKSDYNRGVFDYETLKKWILHKKEYYPKFSKKSPNDFIHLMIEDDVIAWFKALARIDKRFIDLIHITGIPRKHSLNDEIARLSYQIEESERKKSRLSNLCDSSNDLFRLSLKINWEDVYKLFQKNYPKRPQKHVRVIVGFMYLKSKYKLGYKETKRRWLENPYWQLFCGEDFFKVNFPSYLYILEEEKQFDIDIINDMIENAKPENYYKLQ